MGKVSGPIVETIDQIEERGHEGVSFVFSKRSEGVAADGSIDTFVKVGDKETHGVVAISCGGDFYVDIYEAPTTSADGVASSLKNMNRNSTLTTGVTVFTGPTVSAVGTIIKELYVPGGSGGNSSGAIGAGPARPGTELVLKKNTNYLVRVTNKAGQAKTIGVDGSLYERDVL